MSDSDILKKIKVIESELDAYQQEEQKKIEEFMFKSGLTAYLSDVNNKVAKMQGKIEALKELLTSDHDKNGDEKPKILNL